MNEDSVSNCVQCGTEGFRALTDAERERLSQPPVPPTPLTPMQILQDARASYLLPFWLMILCNLSQIWLGFYSLIGSVPMGIVFVVLLLRALSKIGFTAIRIIPLAVLFVLTFPIPFVPILLAALYDRKVFNKIKQLKSEEKVTAPVHAA
jgi:hypothetical protein